jgi:hypothetical protein
MAVVPLKTITYNDAKNPQRLIDMLNANFRQLEWLINHGNISSVNIAENAVDAGHLAAGAVTMDKIDPYAIHAAFYKENTTSITLDTAQQIVLRTPVEVSGDITVIVMVTVMGQASTAQTLTLRLTNNGRDVTPTIKHYCSGSGYYTISASFLVPCDAGIHELIVWGSVNTGTFSIPALSATMVGLARGLKETIVGGNPFIAYAHEVPSGYKQLIKTTTADIGRQVPTGSSLEQPVSYQLTITEQVDVTLV